MRGPWSPQNLSQGRYRRQPLRGRRQREGVENWVRLHSNYVGIYHRAYGFNKGVLANPTPNIWTLELSYVKFRVYELMLGLGWTISSHVPCEDFRGECAPESPHAVVPLVPRVELLSKKNNITCRRPKLPRTLSTALNPKKGFTT